MKRVLFAAVAAFLATTAPAVAQTRVPTDRAAAVEANWDAAGRANARVLELVQAIAGDPRLRAARRPQDQAAFLVEKADAIAAARAELQTIAAQMSARPSISTPGDPLGLRLADQADDDAATFALGADAMMGRLEEYRAAVEAGDVSRQQATSGAMMESGALILDYQATVFASARDMHEADTSDRARNAAFACYYEGTSAYVRGAFALSPPAEATTRIRASAACLRTQAADGRAAIAREGAGSDPLMTQMRAVTGQLLTSVEGAAPTLEQAAADLERQGPSAALGTRYMPSLMAIEQRVMTLQQQEDVIIRQFNGGR